MQQIGTRLVHDCRLLFECHRRRILVAVAMQANLMPFVCNHSALFGESVTALSVYISRQDTVNSSRFQAMTRDEESRRDVVLLEQSQESLYANGACEQSTRSAFAQHQLEISSLCWNSHI